MHLPDIEPNHPKITLSQRTANLLVGLYYEMLTVKPVKFNQNDCNLGVIGHAVESGFINKDKLAPIGWNSVFDCAVQSIGLPERTQKGDEEYHGVLDDFLFGGTDDIREQGKLLTLPSRVDPKSRKKLTPVDACVRIAAVLDRAGWDITELPEVS